jgi:hypothetical protein
VSFDRSSGTARGRVYQAVVRRYRRPRETPRPDAPGCFEDPAPDWVWRLAEAVLEHTEREPDAGRERLEEALAWCEASPDPAARSARLVRLLGPTLGEIGPLARLRAFLDGAWRGKPTHAA